MIVDVKFQGFTSEGGSSRCSLAWYPPGTADDYRWLPRNASMTKSSEQIDYNFFPHFFPHFFLIIFGAFKASGHLGFWGYFQGTVVM